MGVYKFTLPGTFVNPRTVYKSMLAGNTAAPAVTGSMDSLQVITVGAAGASSVSFTNIPNTYAHLQIRGFCGTSSNAPVNMYYNSDTTAANYAYHRLVGDGSTASAAAATSLPRILDLSGNSTFFYASVIDILDYRNTNKNKTARALQGYDTNAGSPTGQITLASELWLSTNAVNSILLSPTSGTFVEYSQFALYGITAAA